jgi:hypothetical protein
MIFFCVGVMYPGEYDACDVALSVYPHPASLKNMPGQGGNRTYDLWNTSPRHIIQACPVWIYTQSNMTSILTILHQCLPDKLHDLLFQRSLGSSVEIQSVDVSSPHVEPERETFPRRPCGRSDGAALDLSFVAS